MQTTTPGKSFCNLPFAMIADVRINKVPVELPTAPEKTNRTRICPGAVRLF